MEVVVKDYKGMDTGRKAKLAEGIFSIDPNTHALYLVIKLYRANQRQGTHKAKERGEIRASTRKIRNQKGSGTARVGSISSPIFRGGGRIFGPRPRSYSFKLNKNLKLLARKSAWSLKAAENSIQVVEDFQMESIKTKNFVAVLDSLGIADKKVLFVLGSANKNVYLSSRNLPSSNVVIHSELSTYDIMNSSAVVLLEGALNEIESNLSK